MTEVYQREQGELGARSPQPEDEISPEMANFNRGLREALSVPRKEIVRRLAEVRSATSHSPRRGPKTKRIT